MDEKSVDFSKKNGFNVICVGDTKSDATLVNRIIENGDSDLLISKYFNNNVFLPNDIFIFRPLINMTNDEVFKFLESSRVNLKRVGDTGDKYFDYSREGCPLQFKDFGVKYSLVLMNELKKYNLICSEFARSKGIKASIHLPSETIVTIPKGYEQECYTYLVSRGIKLKLDTYVATKFWTYTFSINIYPQLLDKSLLCEAFTRFLERLSRKIEEESVSDRYIYLKFADGSTMIMVDSEKMLLLGTMQIDFKLSLGYLENLFLEIFHTYRFNVIENKIII